MKDTIEKDICALDEDKHLETCANEYVKDDLSLTEEDNIKKDRKTHTKYTDDKIISILSEKNLVMLEPYVNVFYKTKFKCNICAYIRETSFQSILTSKNDCPRCCNQERLSDTDKNNLIFSAEEKEILDGLMLGDGCLSKWKKSSNAMLEVTRCDKDKSTILYHANIFLRFMTENGVKESSTFDNRTNKTYFKIRMRSRALPCFTEAHDRWYPNGKKIVPKDLILSSRTIATWIADDGSLNIHSRYGKIYPNELRLSLATNGFTQEEVLFLRELLFKKYGFQPLISRANKEGSQFAIEIVKKDHVKIILTDIDTYFPPMSRKSDKWRKLYNISSVSEEGK